MTLLHAAGTGRFVPSTARSFLQLGISAVGTLLILWGLFGLALVFPSMPQSGSGFAEGLALILFGLSVLGGFVTLSVGLLIPQNETGGVQFTSRQRRLLAYGVVAPVTGVLAIPVVLQLAPAFVEPVRPILVGALVAFALTGPLATLSTIVTKVRSRNE